MEQKARRKKGEEREQTFKETRSMNEKEQGQDKLSRRLRTEEKSNRVSGVELERVNLLR
jgi:hypothetical protein